jgi:beta-mannosidase
MIRVWGGGRYEPDWFYDLCDELGLMVWQDFMFACHLYPSTPGFLAEVDAEVRGNVLRLNHHPSIALWCGDNELVGALSWFEESRVDRDRYLVSYDRLNRTVEDALKATLPSANWWPSSPSPGPLSFGDAWHDDSHGDMHFWSVWHEGRDFEHYRDVSPRFCSEFGFQSYPSMDVVRTFAEPADWNIASPVLESHQKNKGRYFRFPTGFENFVYLSQVQQALAMQTAVDHWRGLKPHCMGTLYWQLNDTWPCASWSSLDYGGGWKLLHHVARRFYAPLRAMVMPRKDGFLFRAVNDGRAETTVTLEVFAVDVAGATRRLAKATKMVGLDLPAEMAHVPSDSVGAHEMLLYRWSDAAGNGGEEHFAQRPYKTYDLRQPDIVTELEPARDGWSVRLTSEALALFVSIETANGRLSDNCVTLVPGASRTLHLKTGEDVPILKVRDLYAATYN